MKDPLLAWDAAAFRALIAAAQRIGTPARALLGMLLSESDGCPGPALLHGNPKPNAVGLNQILLTNLHYVWRASWQEYEALSVADQMPYVERWIRSQPGPKTDGSRLYLSNYLPGYWPHGGEPDYILCSPTRHPEWYGPNWPAFDPWLTAPEPKWEPKQSRHGEKAYITVGDLGARIERKLATTQGQRFAAALTALESMPPPALDEDPGTSLASESMLQLLKLPPDIDVRAWPPPPGARKKT